MKKGIYWNSKHNHFLILYPDNTQQIMFGEHEWWSFIYFSWKDILKKYNWYLIQEFK